MSKITHRVTITLEVEDLGNRTVVSATAEGQDPRFSFVHNLVADNTQFMSSTGWVGAAVNNALSALARQPNRLLELGELR